MQTQAGPGAAWRSWSRAQWNDVLVDAVFRHRPAGTIIRRLDTTRSWMARIAGADESRADEVRTAFLHQFRDYRLAARALFDPARLTRGWTPERPDLPFFAELYLSLVVASADERTADLGRYRERLTELTGIGAGALIGHELPRLWRQAALWTSSTAATDVARLVLPSPGNEAIIGIAKRLAFPGHADQQRLASLLARTGLDDRAPVIDLMAALRVGLAGFSEHFQTEFREFRERYQRDPLDAARTPFWQALQEISWTHAAVAADSRCVLDLELDPSDPRDARLIVLATGILPGFDDWTRFDDPAFATGTCAIARTDHRAGRVVETLQRDAVRDEGTATLQARRLRLGLRSGLLAFTRQDLDRWTLAERLASGDDCWLVARHDIAGRFGEELRTRTDHPLYRAPLPGSHAWKLIGPLPVTDATRILLAGIAGTRLFDARMPSARIELSGSVTLPGGVYLRRPLLPAARVDLADSCRFQTTGPDGTVLAEGAMIDRGGAIHALPPDLMTGGVARLRIDVHGAEGLVASRTIEVVGRCTADRPTPLSRADHWLVDDDVGGLVALAQPSPSDRHTTLPARPGLTAIGGRISRCRQIPATDLSSDLVEMFVAMLARRQTLPASRALELIRELLGGSLADGWATLTTLVENQVVRLVSPRHWRGLAVAGVAPEGWLVDHGEGYRARVVGMLGELQRLRLAEAAARHGAAVTVHVGDDPGSVGATGFTAPDAAVAEDILGAVGIVARRPGTPRAVEPIGFLPCSEVDPPTGTRSRWWSPAHAVFGDHRGDGPVALELRSFERLRDLFVLTTPDRAFVTESRRWALLAWATACGIPVGEVSASGDVTLSRPYLALPPSVARTTAILGAGVVTRDDGGRLVHGAGGTRALVDQLAAWCRADRTYSTPATDLVRSLARTSGRAGLGIALGRHARTLTDKRRSAG